MKVGIITVHRAYNYGSVLQCYALQKVLQEMGHDVWVIDYRQRWTEAVYKPFSLYYVWFFLKKKNLHAIVAYWRERKERAERLIVSKAVFEPFLGHFRLTAPCHNLLPQDFDVYIVGSDQLWSHSCVGGEDNVYLGYFRRPKKSRLVGYALSAGVNSLYVLGKKRLANILENFDKISLRESSNAETVKALTGKCLPICVDPTLLTDVSMWQSMINSSWRQKKYIAVYQVRHAAGQQELLLAKAQRFANELHCEVVDLSSADYSVEDFISAIKYAQYVFTTSFHATVFSILMETPCYVVKLNDGLDVRYVDLLTNLGLGEELVDADFTPKPFQVDFQVVKSKILEYQKSSLDYLKNI